MTTLPRSIACLFAATLALPVLAWAQDAQHAPGTIHATAHELAREDHTISATVLAVDPSTRYVTLRGASGREVTVQAGPEVQNLDQLKVGDQVTAHYQSALAVQVVPADSASTGVQYQGGHGSAPSGGEPGLQAGQTVTVTSKLSAVDLKHHTVTLTGPDGHERTIEVTDPARQAQLSKLKVGDMVVATYVEALAVTVTPKAKAADAK